MRRLQGPMPSLWLQATSLGFPLSLNVLDDEKEKPVKLHYFILVEV